MPKKLFYNINEEKQEMIFMAAFEEFSKHQYMDASINKIVQNSMISRGSFYLYFEDKLDIYLFTTDKIMDIQSKLFLLKTKKIKNIDLFKLYKELFVFNMNLLSDTTYNHYFENLYLGMNYEILRHIRKKQRKIKEHFFKRISVEYTENDLSEYTEALISILEMINQEMLVKKIVDDLSQEDILNLYDTRIRLLKRKEDY